eukprot:gene33785-43656_t
MLAKNRLFISLLCLLISTYSFPNTNFGRVIAGYSTLTVSGNCGLYSSHIGYRHKYRTDDDHTVQISSSAISTVEGSESETAKLQRVQRLKDLSLQKEILKDVTAAEFALRIEVSSSSEPQETATTAAIDYGKLISKLEENIETISNRPELNNLGEKEPSQEVVNDIGAISSQRSINLTTRIVHVKEDLELAAKGLPPKHMADYLSEGNIVESVQEPSTATATITSPGNGIRGLRILVREDGTVDWDGAIASGREVARFGAELWERLNGKEKEEGLPSLAEIFGQAEVKSIETDEIKSLKAIVSESKQDVSDAVTTRNILREKLRELRRAGDVEVSQEDVQTLRQLDVRIKELEKRLKLYTLNLDMEKVCEYIQQELDSSSDPADQKLFIAEVALIDKQIMTMASGLINMSPPLGNNISQSGIASLSDDKTDQMISNLISLIDDDELNLVYGELIDLKSRLGLDTQLAPAMDWGTLGVFVKETINKINEGTKVLVGDVQYAGVLLIRAIRGYTEVNALRRTGKDLLVLVPFTIILIIPLSPVGHVLVFSFIQRYFPDFYPTCYSEKRLNLKRLFNEIELKRDNTDLLGEEEISFSQILPSISRLEKTLTTFAKNTVAWVSGVIVNESSDNKPDSQ